jgi:hypothetical protein
MAGGALSKPSLSMLPKKHNFCVSITDYLSPSLRETMNQSIIMNQKKLRTNQFQPKETQNQSISVKRNSESISLNQKNQCGVLVSEWG